MPSHALRLLVATAVLAAASAGADPLPDPCPLPGDSAHPLADRAGLLAQYERLPHACLQELVRACTEVSNRALMDFGTASACSFGYEALLSQRFGGNFQALMAWWNSERRPALQ
jgi:hypothetical protein